MSTFKLGSLAAGVAIAAAIAGCGGSGSPKTPVSARLQSIPGSSVGQVVLTQLGAQRIGVQTAPAQRAAGAGTAGGGQRSVVIPYSAVVYDPSGQTYAFRQVAPLTYVEMPVKVDHVAGNSAYLAKGPRAGTPIVTVGAEELFGVQTGVLAQT